MKCCQSMNQLNERHSEIYSVIIYAACLVINYSILEKNVTTQSIVRKYCMDKKLL
jgi:hypothetical protein